MDGKVRPLYLRQMRERVGGAHTGVNGHSERTATERHRNFERWIIADDSQVCRSRAKAPACTSKRFERGLADDMNAATGEIPNHCGDRARSAERLTPGGREK